MKKSYKVQHKTDGWTGSIELETDNIRVEYTASHRLGGVIPFELVQDAHDKNGQYHEDPRIESFEELDFIE